MTDKVNAYEAVTRQIVARVEADPGKWSMPWHQAGLDLPLNARTRRRYRGINIVSLWCAAQAHGYSTPHWATYKQWGEMKAQVRKGERASLVVFWKEYTSEGQNEAGETVKSKRLFARLSYAFNAAQVDGWEPPPPPAKSEFDKIADAENIVKATGAVVKHGGGHAFYVPSQDYIQIPEPGDFIGTKTSTPQEAYYGTLFHELGHWTGAKDRLDRNLSTRFNTNAYAAEELVAELTSAFVCCRIGMSQEPRDDHAQYISSWLNIMKGDSKAIFTAASLAERAANYILGETQEEEAV